MAATVAGLFRLSDSRQPSSLRFASLDPGQGTAPNGKKLLQSKGLRRHGPCGSTGRANLAQRERGEGSSASARSLPFLVRPQRPGRRIRVAFGAHRSGTRSRQPRPAPRFPPPGSPIDSPGSGRNCGSGRCLESDRRHPHSSAAIWTASEFPGGRVALEMHAALPDPAGLPTRPRPSGRTSLHWAFRLLPGRLGKARSGSRPRRQAGSHFPARWRREEPSARPGERRRRGTDLVFDGWVETATRAPMTAIEPTAMPAPGATVVQARVSGSAGQAIVLRSASTCSNHASSLPSMRRTRSGCREARSASSPGSSARL